MVLLKKNRYTVSYSFVQLEDCKETLFSEKQILKSGIGTESNFINFVENE